jgi:CRP/FNR family cyclic AMP-dependent transcriptional regulator
MDQAKIIEFLASVPLFAGLNDRQKQRIARRFSQRTYQTGETIIHQGHIGVGLFIIVSGEVEVIREDGDGNKNHVATIGRGEFFGEFSLIDEAPRIATVNATSSVVECLILSRLDFLAALQEDTEMPLVIMRELVGRLRNLLGR